MMYIVLYICNHKCNHNYIDAKELYMIFSSITYTNKFIPDHSVGSCNHNNTDLTHNQTSQQYCE